MLYLLGDWLIKKLLAFDMTLHGSIVRDTFADVDPLQFFDCKGVVVCSGPDKARNYLERALSHVMVAEPFVEEENLSGTQVLYQFDHLDRNVKVRAFFYFNWPSPPSFPKLDLDVNRLAINRTNFFVMEAPGFSKEPSLLYELMVQCKKRQFRIVDPSVTPTWKIERTKRMLKQGWTHLDAAVQVVQYEWDAEEKCAICQDLLAGKQPVCRTRCNHFFHKKCWVNYLRNGRTTTQRLVRFLNPEPIECPLCRHPMELYEVQV